MKNLPPATRAGLIAVALSFGLVGCGSSTDTAASTTTSASTSTSTEVSTTASSPPAADESINEYITKNDIAEVPIKPGEPGDPDVRFSNPCAMG